MQHAAPPFLRMTGITKSFGGVEALRGVDFDVTPGEVVALVGENGAGKSTLARIAAGVHRADGGTIRLEGRPIRIDSVPDALACGIVLIHQELNLADNLDVAGNVLLGHEPRLPGPFNLLDRRRLHERARRIIARVGLDTATSSRVAGLSVGRRQLVEVARALALEARLVLMDEPTSSLSRSETEGLLRVIRELRAHGTGIVFVSHRLDEVLAVADRIVVLRDGLAAGELSRAQATRERIVRMMVGREIKTTEHARPRAGRPALVVHGLRTSAHPRHCVSFTLREGEIVGLAGLVGAGRSELATTLFGLTRPRAGHIEAAGRRFVPRNPRQAIKAGLGLVPEDRNRQGLILEMAISANVTLAAPERVSRGPFLSRREENRVTRRMAEALSIQMSHPAQHCRELSGGNQQKAVLARWLLLEPKILMLDEPTRGIDVGAKQEIYRLITRLSGRGVAVLMISSELEEIIMLSDRVLVMAEGRLAGELDRGRLSEEAVMQMATEMA